MTTTGQFVLTPGTLVSQTNYSHEITPSINITTGGTGDMSSGNDWTTSTPDKMSETVHPTANLSILTTAAIPNIIVEVSETAETIIAIYMGFLVVFGIFNNSVVLFLYHKYRNLQNPINMFLINISISDLIVSVFGSPFMFASTIAGHWLFGDFGCTWYAFITTLGGCEQIVALAAVSIQRCFLVVRPFTAKKMTSRWAVFFLSFTWMYCLVISLPPVFGWNSYVIEGAGTACSVDWVSRNPNDTSYIIFIFIMVLAIPLSIIFGSYALLLYAVKKMGESDAARSSSTKADKKVTIMVVIMISCFLIAWTPYSVFALYVAAGNEDKVTPIMGTAPALFAKACTVYNPIIYFLLNKQFKEALIDWVFCGRNPFEKEESEADNSRRGQLTTVSQTVSKRNKNKMERTMSCATEVSDIGASVATPVSHRRQILVAPANTAAFADTVEEQQDIPSASGEGSSPARKSSPAETSLNRSDGKTLKPPSHKALKNRATVTPLLEQANTNSGPTKVDT